MDENLDPLALLREQVGAAHHELEWTMEDVTQEQAEWRPPGRAVALGPVYAHLIMAEDNVIHGLVSTDPPLHVTSWAGRTGMSEPMPFHGLVEGDIGRWQETVRVDLAAVRKYAHAVYASTDDALAALDPGDLRREVDLSALGLGMTSLAMGLSVLIIFHCANICGEISCLKGLQGARGYPF